MATTVDLVKVPAQSEIIIPVHVGKFKHETTVILEPKGNLSIEHQVAGGKTISTVLRGIASYRLMNPTNSTVYIPRRTKIAKAETIQSNRVTKFTEGSSAPINSLSETTSNQLCSEFSDLGFNLDNLKLTPEQKQQIQNFLIQNRDIFAKDLSELGHTNLHYHTIYTGDAKPISAAPYKQSPQMRRELDKQLDEMQRYNIIEESISPWHSPVVLVKKRNGSIRVCVDFRALNRITEPMSAVIPTMTDIFDTLADSKAEIFSSLDLTSGFWQVPLDPATKHKSAFITHKGVYEFNRLPFGMMNSPLTFQCLMTKVLKDLNFKIALVYIDDILIFSKNFEDHLNHLQQVFSNLREANLKLNPEKCKFATRTIGHVISKDGIRVNPENTEKVKDFCRPNTAKQVKSFLGMANYYRKFVKDYAHIAAPLTKLLKKDQRFRWTPECEIAFENLKHRLTSAPILSFPHLDKPFILATDSSEFSNGYILSQIQNGLEHVIAYGVKYLQKIKDCQGRQKHLEINNSASYDSSELADHLGSIDIQKEYIEVTFIYKGENEDAVISSLQTVTINDNQLTNLAEEKETCKDFADIIKYKQSGRVPQNPELARAVVAKSFNFQLEHRILKHFYSKRCKKVPKDERLVKQVAVPKNLHEFQNDNEELNPEEIQDDNIDDNDQLLPNNHQQPKPPINNGINRQQPPIPVINNNRPTQDQQQLPVDKINNRQQNQQPAQNSETNKRNAGPSGDSTVNTPVKDNKPSCQDCKNNKCKAFKEEEIQQVLSSVRGNGTLYYKLKFTDKSRNTECKVTDDISTQTETINEQDQGNEHQQLLAVRIDNNRPYFLIKSGNTTKYESMTSVPNTARQVLIDHKEHFKQALLQQDIQYTMEKRLGKENQRDCSFQIASDGKIHEIRYNMDGTTEYLSGYKNPVIAPEWDTFDSLSNASINNFINVLETQYKIEISMRRR
ncbi:unnamed protein product [Mytilus coruscus]|uniref:Reverse transcriptase domain-containing protein n=1 Tax=Mytilus coruscus TaxID=42192 RepID=A0A6J8BVY6_MYTCO|nr:unnamed protein product [Mytilus coruscus]